VLGRKIVKGPQHVTVFFKALCRLGIFGTVDIVFNRLMVAGDRPGAFWPTRAASASEKSPVETPFI